MLGKLFKYDFKEMGTYYLPLYVIYAGIAAAFAILIVIGQHSTLLEENALFSLLFAVITFAYTLAVIALVIISGLIVVYYFYRKFVSEEAYLTMTLPVKSWQQVLSKLLGSAVWQVITWIIFAVSVGLVLLITGAIKEIMNDLEISMAIRMIWIQFSHEISMNVGTVVLGVIYGVIFLITSPLIYFAAISVGQMVNKHKVLMSVAAYVIISIVVTFITANSTLNIFTDTINQLLVVSIIEQIITSVIYFGISVYFLTRNLNLE